MIARRPFSIWYEPASDRKGYAGRDIIPLPVRQHGILRAIVNRASRKSQLSLSDYRNDAAVNCELRRDLSPHYFNDGVRQFRIAVTDVSTEVSVMIRNRPSGAMSQLIGPLRIPVSTIPV
jgi:hypothetical protein